jgi:outer membrane protein assembly factor BamB
MTQSPPLYRALVLTAWIAAMFCLTVGAVMIYEHVVAATNDPWKSPQLLALKEKLADEPHNQALQDQIRLLDLDFRRKFHRRLALDETGGWLIVGGALVLVLAAARAAALRKPLPEPQPNPDSAEHAARLASRARWSVAAAGVVVAGSLAAVRLANTSALPNGPAVASQTIAQPAPAEIAPSLAAFQTNWPRFRGWDGSAVCSNGGPVEAVLWSSPVPAPGHSSPIVWGDRVFVSGATADRRAVFCYNAASGALLWQRTLDNVPGSPPKAAEVPDDTGYAAPTMATDGRRVYVMFANGDLAALNFDGAVVWSKYLGPLKNAYGAATSLAVWGLDLILQLDQGDSRPAGSKLVCMQGADGKVLWERSRPVPASWATPIIIEAAGRTQIVTLANPWVIAYTAAEGNELWRAQLLENEVVPSPVFAGGFLLLASPGTRLMALRPDGAGDVTKTHVAWTNEDNTPDVTSPVSDGKLAFTVTSGGVATCFDVAGGKKIWEKDLETQVQASPAIMGGRLFILGQNGSLVIMEAAREFHEVGRIPLPDKFTASPAFAGGRVFVRGMTNLYSLGSKAAGQSL